MDIHAIESIQQQLKRINAHVRQVMARELADYEVTLQQLFVLKTIHAHPGINLKTLSSRMSLNKSSISLMTDKLVEDGYVVRSINDADRRNIQIHLTDEGIRVVDQVSPILRNALCFLLKDLSDTDLKEIARSMELLGSAMDAAMVHYDKRWCSHE